MLGKLREFDFYRKIPKDLTEASTHGSILSIGGSIFMITLFVVELWAFLSYQFVTTVVIDPNTDSLLRINFNITVLDLPCDFATIDAVDVLGYRQDNVSKHINKWSINVDGGRAAYKGRNVEQKDIMHAMHHDMDELSANGLHAVPVDEQIYDQWLSEHTNTFVNFYAPWCIWCQRLEPVWEAFAEEVEREQLPVSVIRVDCVANQNLCTSNRVHAFPTLRFFQGNVLQYPEYQTDRTVEAFITYAKEHLKTQDKLAEMAPHEIESHFADLDRGRNDHPGCLMTGFLMVNKVPGNFHIEARSKLHNLNPFMANLSHVVHHLSFGGHFSRSQRARLEILPEEVFSLKSINRIDGNEYVSTKLHQASHHYIKVVSTLIEPGYLNNDFKGKNVLSAYQMVQSSQLMQYRDDEIPEARFSYDLSPMAVVISKKGKHWYEFVTSICALIGGTFTVVGLLSSFLGALFKTKRG